MEMDEQDLRWGLEFIVGTWQVDYLVDTNSADLAHIPVDKFKSDDGNDFSSFSFEFFEDHTVIVKDSSGKEEDGTWEQTENYKYHYTLSSFFDITDESMKNDAETLNVNDGQLTFLIGNLIVALKKTAEGTVTSAPDIGDMESDPSMTDIIGKYKVVKMMNFESLELNTKEQIKADLDKKKAAGEIDDDEYAQGLLFFDMVIEFTADGKVVSTIMGESDIKEWKAVDGKYYINTQEEVEVYGEKQSPWKEIEFEEDGLMKLEEGMMLVQKA